MTHPSLRRKKPIARRSAPIKRTSRPRHKRKGRQAALRQKADILWATVVKKQARCEFVGTLVGNKPHECKGALQAMHGIPRTYSSTRWLPINGFSGCQGVHWYYTVRKEEWAHYLLNAWGETVFNELWSIARKMEKPDLLATIAKLEQELVAA